MLIVTIVHILIICVHCSRIRDGEHEHVLLHARAAAPVCQLQNSQHSERFLDHPMVRRLFQRALRPHILSVKLTHSILILSVPVQYSCSPNTVGVRLAARLTLLGQVVQPVPAAERPDVHLLREQSARSSAFAAGLFLIYTPFSNFCPIS